jgi:hypothetical protein
MGSLLWLSSEIMSEFNRRFAVARPVCTYQKEPWFWRLFVDAETETISILHVAPMKLTNNQYRSSAEQIDARYAARQTPVPHRPGNLGGCMQGPCAELNAVLGSFVPALHGVCALSVSISGRTPSVPDGSFVLRAAALSSLLM